jgi:Flp pilus assembly pilin Flp
MCIQRFLREENGLELPEYALISTLISAAIVTAVVALNGAVGTSFRELLQQFTL